MRKILSIVSLILLLACTEEVKDEQSSKPKSDSVVAKIDSIKPEDSWEYEEVRLKKEYAEQLKSFKISMQKKTFDFLCYDKCDGGAGVNYEEIKKYGLENPFDIKKVITKDTLTISFKFISSCCLEYIGDVQKRNDSLFLSYKNISYTPCDCRCYYYYMYSLPIEKYASKSIMLNNIAIKK